MVEITEETKVVETRQEEEFFIKANYGDGDHIIVRVEFEGFEDATERAGLADYLLNRVSQILGD